MCLICALRLKKCLAVCLTACLVPDARRGGFVPVYRLFDSKKACPVRSRAGSFGQLGHLLEDAGRDVLSPGLAGTFAPFQLGVLLDHVLPELVLPLHKVLAVADDLLGAQPPVSSQGHKAEVQMGRFGWVPVRFLPRPCRCCPKRQQVGCHGLGKILLSAVRPQYSFGPDGKGL